MSGFICSYCGQHHGELPLSYRAEAPQNWLGLSRWQRLRSKLNADLCVIENKEFYVRGRLELPVSNGSEAFSWDVWVSLSETNYRRALELWKNQAVKASRHISDGYPQNCHFIRKP